MFSNFKNRKLRSKWQIDLALHEAFAVAGSDGAALQRLVLRVQQQTQMLCALPAGGYASFAPAQTFVDGLLALSAFQRSWRRTVETWSPTQGSAWSQFDSLAHHLFAKRATPRFMTSAWFEGRSVEARRHQQWFKHLALGYGIRGVATPIRLTTLMGRCFSQAPQHCTVNQAIRWSQVRGWGGEPALADAIVATRLGRTFDHDEYWSLVIRFLIDSPNMTTSNVGSVIEYLDRHYDPFRLNPGRKWSRKEAADELLRNVRQWRGESAGPRKRPSLAWKNSGIGGFEYHDERQVWQPTAWRIRELLDSNELLEEGRNMRHCVGRYGHKCASGLTTIWSLTCSDRRSQSRRELTIEVNPKNRKIVQAKGLHNSKPKPAAHRVMLLWAKARGLNAEEWW